MLSPGMKSGAFGSLASPGFSSAEARHCPAAGQSLKCSFWWQISTEASQPLELGNASNLECFPFGNYRCSWAPKKRGGVMDVEADDYCALD